LAKQPDLDFLYYSNDMIGAGGLLFCLEKGLSVPSDIGLAGFNGVDLIDGLPRKLATMDSCRVEIGTIAAEIIAAEADKSAAPHDKRVELSPKFAPGDTLR
jgi:LacI family gluconate utilization system Gnt-I transcriptional repressor